MLSKKNYRVLLIYPPVLLYGSGRIDPHIPTGLVYIATYLKSLGYRVKILDALSYQKVSKFKNNITRIGLSYKDIRKKVSSFKPNLIGISVMYSAFEDDGIKLAKYLKENFNNIPIVLGGSAISVHPDEIMSQNKEIDFVVKGEGEISMEDLIKALRASKNFSDISGLYWRDSSKVLHNGVSFVKNLDKLPFPDYDFLNLKKYFSKKDLFTLRNRMFPIVTSRGCPNHCMYCSIHAVYNHMWRGRSPGNVVCELEYLIKKYKANGFYIQDDSVSVDIDRLKAICKIIIKKKLDLKWTTPNGIAHWTLDEEALDLMKKAGCYRITFGIESGNIEIRKWVGKPYDLKQATKLTKYANKIGLWTLSTNIIGFPYESRQQIEDTISYAIKSDVDFALFFRLSPRPGTKVYEVFEKEGWLPKNKKYLLSEDIACQTRYFKPGELLEIQNYAYRKFLSRRLINFLNPTRVLRKIKNSEDFVYVLGLGYQGIKMALSLIKTKTGITSKVYRS